jgi:type II secretory pathway pseudopilin PulG
MKSVVAILATTLLILSPVPFIQAQSPDLQELQKQLQQLKQENQLLRELLTQGNTTTATPPVKPATAQGGQTDATAGSNDQQSLTHWLTTSSSKRHNSSCRWYRTSHGRPCRADEGIPCKICGG